MNAKEPAQGQLRQLLQEGTIKDLKIVTDNIYEIRYFPRPAKHNYAKSYRLNLTLPTDYPESPPKVTFIDPIHHPNVHPANGNLFMALLFDDWCPFLTLHDVLESLNSILDEPDLSYAADEQAKLQYLYSPNKYIENAMKLQRQKEQLQFQNDNNTLIQALQQDQKCSKGQEDPQECFILAISPSEQEIINKYSERQLQLQNRNLNIIVEQSELPTDRVHTQPKANTERIKTANIILNGSISKKTDIDKNFNEIMRSIAKADELFRIMIIECDSMQHKLQNTKNDRLRKIISDKYENELKMLEETLQISHELKTKLFVNLKETVKQAL